MTKRARKSTGRSGSRRPATNAFWGEIDLEPPPRIRPTTDPGAVPRSLGTPPLSAPPQAVQGQLQIVYAEAVRAATALAAAAGLLEDDL
ncbi:MAG TPA: hypothetical protein VF954_07045 [Acidimicrobiales bacterium]